jgi:hypothetical protein
MVGDVDLTVEALEPPEGSTRGLSSTCTASAPTSVGTAKNVPFGICAMPAQNFRHDQHVVRTAERERLSKQSRGGLVAELAARVDAKPQCGKGESQVATVNSPHTFP